MYWYFQHNAARLPRLSEVPRAACVKNVLVLFVVAKRNNFEEQFFIRYINKESKPFPHNVPGFTMEIKTIVAMGVAET